MDVTHIGLSISRLSLDLDLSGLKPRVRLDLSETFSPFLDSNGRAFHETLDIIPVKNHRWKRYVPEHEEVLRDGLRMPLSKFPFAPDEDEAFYGLHKKIRPFLKDDRIRAYFSRSEDLRNIVLFLPAFGCLIRHVDTGKSAFFLQSGARSWAKIAAIYSAIYFTSSLALPSHDSLLLHGVGIHRLGKGFMFLGLSGDGKSTLAGFSLPKDVLSDDGIIVERVGEALYLAPTPFDPFSLMKRRDAAFGARRRRLCMGFFLKKSDRVSLEKVPPSEAGAVILKNHIHFFRYFPERILEKAFYLVADLCRQIPFYRLCFRKDASFWIEIEKELSAIENH